MSMKFNLFLMTTQTKETTTDNFSSFELVDENNYFLWSLYDRSGNENNDEITKDGFAKWTSLIQKRKISIKEYLKMYPSVSLVTTKTAVRLQQKHYEKKYNAYKSYVITESKYNEMLNVLPPDEWLKTDLVPWVDFIESFKLSECVAGNLYDYYVILILANKKRCFRVTLPSGTNQEEIARICTKHFLKLEGVRK